MVHIFPSVATWARRTQVARVLDGGYLLCSVHERSVHERNSKSTTNIMITIELLSTERKCDFDL